MKSLSIKNSAIAPSMTLAITAKAKQLKSQGVDVLSFSAGEPDFNTPENIRKCATDRIEKGGIGYTPASGLPELKAAICHKLKVDNGLDYKSSQIVVSNGAKHSLYNTLSAVLNHGDEVIIFSPYWVSYYELIKLADGVPVIVKTSAENQYRIDCNQLEQVVNERTKALIINSPNNPTGTVYPKEDLEAIAAFAKKHDLYIISDEIYEKLIYGETHYSIAGLSEDAKARTIVVNGLSKAYAMTGWRIGYTASSDEIAKIMNNVQSHATSNPNTIAQYAGIEALMGSQDTIETMRQAFDERRNYMVKRIGSIDGLSCTNPKGAFYIMVDITACFGKKIGETEIKDSLGFANAFLENYDVAVIPGVAFDADDYIRLSYATSLDVIQKGLDRLEAFVSALK